MVTKRSYHPSKYDSRRGSNAKHYKEKVRQSAGYIWVHSPKHPFADHAGRIYEHRQVWEQYHNAMLLPWASVHHINKRRDDNRIENLEGILKSKHTKLHNPRLGTGRKNVEIECACGCGEKRMKYYQHSERRYICGHNRSKKHLGRMN